MLPTQKRANAFALSLSRAGLRDQLARPRQGIGLDRFWGSGHATPPDFAVARVRKDSAVMVGGDGFEPPTLSV